jgi:galactokinase
MAAGEPRLFRAPGRVNLIGEHTDYNDGFVLPAAIERETVVGAGPRRDRTVRARSVDDGAAVSFDLDGAGTPRRGGWIDHVEGVARSLEASGARLRGCDIVFATDIPIGAGLASSAALQVAAGMALLAIAGHAIDSKGDRLKLARAGQQAEHAWVGTQCGIMDQFASAFGRADHALFLDCRSLVHEHVRLDPQKAALLVVDTGVKRRLADGAYNQRRAECAESVRLLRERLPPIDSKGESAGVLPARRRIRALRDVSIADFTLEGSCLPEPLRRRCRHVVTENERTLSAVVAIRGDKLGEMRMLMESSHRSLRDDYEVSCPELDLLVEKALSLPGVFGARMTGGGFGGSTVNLVAPEAIEEVSTALRAAFERRFGRTPTVLATRASEGCSEI